MLLYMQQKLFSLKNKFTVKDASGKDVFQVEGKVISFGRKVGIYDMNGEELAYIRQKPVSLLPCFIVERDGEEAARIVKKMSFFKPKYIIEGIGWRVEGNFSEHDYTVYEGDAAVVSIHKKWMSWGDSFELDVRKESETVMAVAVVLAIDAVMDSQAAAAATT